MTEANALLLDYGGVVADHYCEPATSQLALALGVDQSEIESLISERTEYGAALRLNHIGPEQFWSRVMEVGMRKRAGALDWRNAHRLWAESYIPNGAVLELMWSARVKSKWKVGILSNMDEARFQHVWELIDWSRYCDLFLCSWEIGILKPNHKFYRIAIDRLSPGMSPDKVLYVDDRFEHVAAASGVGCQGYVFDSAEGLRGALAAHE